MAFSQQQSATLTQSKMYTQASSTETVASQNTVASYYSKRLLDLTLIGLSSLFLIPVLVIVGLLIKLDSPGPIFYRQQRVGAKPKFHNGYVKWETASFSIFKFRSMYSDTDDAIHQAHVRAWMNGELDDDGAQAKAKVKNDSRITRIGHFIRKTSIDELPQLLNVVRGEMSLVGPRPVPEYEVAQYDPEHYERLKALPGMTGLWQVLGRGMVSFEEMMELDIRYVRTRSLGRDILILLKTLPAVMSGSGAA